MRILVFIFLAMTFIIRAEDTTIIDIEKYGFFNIDVALSEADIIAKGMFVKSDTIWSDNLNCYLTKLTFKMDSIYKGDKDIKEVGVLFYNFELQKYYNNKDFFKSSYLLFLKRKDLSPYYSIYSNEFYLSQNLIHYNVNEDDIKNISKIFKKDGYFKIINSQVPEYSLKTNEGYIKNGKPFGYWKFSEGVSLNIYDTLTMEYELVDTINAYMDTYFYYNASGIRDSNCYSIINNDTIYFNKLLNGEVVQHIAYESGKRTYAYYKIGDEYIEENYDNGTICSESTTCLIPNAPFFKFNSNNFTSFTRWNTYIRKNNEQNYKMFYPYSVLLHRKTNENKNKETGIYITPNYNCQYKIGNFVYYDDYGKPIRIEEYDENGNLIKSYDVQTK